MRKKVSMIMPVGDVTPYFAEAVQSVLTQTYGDFEFLIIDGSGDRRKVPGLLPEDNRIRLLHREKRGAFDARNYGALQAKGEYVAWMDADDISLKQRLEKQVIFLDDNPDIDVVGTWFYITKEDGEPITESRPPTNYERIVANMLFENPICQPSVMMRRKVFEEGMRYPNAVAEDYALWTSMIPKYRFANIPESLLYWRRHGNANTNLMMDEVSDSDIESSIDFIHRIFGMEMRELKNKKELLVKNYFRKKLQDIYRKKGAEFIVGEYLFLNDLKRKCPVEIKEEVDCEIKKRWETLLTIVGCFTDGAKQFFGYSWPDEAEKEYHENAEIIRKIMEENEKKRCEILGKEYSVIFYGMGDEGAQALHAYEKAASVGRTRWRIAGLIDRGVRSVTVNGIEHAVCRYEKLTEFSPDFIVITTSSYYGEIEKKLIEDGFDSKKIMSDAILHCIYEGE